MYKPFFIAMSCMFFVQQAAHAMYPLHIAASLGDVDQVTALLNNSDTDVNQTNDGGDTPLRFAASYYHEEVVQLLLEHGADVNLPNRAGCTPLYYAAYTSDEKIVRLLLEHGANVDQPSNDGWTPLKTAAHSDLIPVARVLLEYGANPNLVDILGNTSLQCRHKAIAHLLQEWSQKQQEMLQAVRLTFCLALLQRPGANSPANTLVPDLLPAILRHLRPEYFIPAPNSTK